MPSGPKWTDDEIEYLRQNYAVTPLAELAAKLHRSVRGVKWRACMHGIRRREQAPPVRRQKPIITVKTDEQVMKAAFFIALNTVSEYRNQYKISGETDWMEFFCAVRKYANNIRIGS